MSNLYKWQKMAIKRSTETKAKAKINSDEWHEQEYVVAMVEGVEFDPYTGDKVSKPYEYTTNIRHWNTVFLKNQDMLGLSVIEIIRLPEGANKPEHIGYPKRKKAINS